MLLGLGINAARERVHQPEAMYSQLRYYNSSVPISDVEVENMSSWESSNEKLMVFDIANSRSKIKSSVLSTEMEQKNIRGGNV